MQGRRTNKGWAQVSQSKFAGGRCKRYCLESWSAVPSPVNGKVQPACLTLSNHDGGPPMHHIYCDQMQRLTTSQCRSIVIELAGGGEVEITAEDDKEWRRWTKHIALLLSIPSYPIPEEPRAQHLPADLLNDLDPHFYDPRGVMAWGGCVLQDGIGAAASLRNALCVAVVTEDDQIKVFPWKVTAAQVVWDRNKLRRSGSIGDLVFLEAGRRCRHGPGLLWMFTKSDVALSLREGLHTFLFKGNKAVAVTTRRDSQVSLCSQRSSGVDVSFDSAPGGAGHPFTPERSASGVLCRQPSTLSSVDSVASDSGIGKSKSPDYKPQVPLHSHPSLQRKHYSSRHSAHSLNEGDSPEPDDVAVGTATATTVSGVSRQQSQFSEDLFDLDEGVPHEERRSPPQQGGGMGEQQYIVMARPSSSSPREVAEEYIPMARMSFPSSSTSSSSSSSTSSTSSSDHPGLHYPQNQQKLLKDMGSRCVYDNHKLKSTTLRPMSQQPGKVGPAPVVNGVSVSGYDNVSLKPGHENYVNTAISRPHIH